jgi:hypothetical protein
MAGLYDGLEELGFKPFAGGYVFQTPNPWLIGRPRRYFASEGQKGRITECLRQTYRAMRAWVIVAALFIPIAIVGCALWFALTGTTLTVTVTDASGGVVSTSELLDAHGIIGTLHGTQGQTVVYTISGPPSTGSTLTVTPYDATGKAGKPSVVPFAASGSTITLTNGAVTVSTVHLSARSGHGLGGTKWPTMLVTFGLYAVYVAAIHIYRTRRLRPVLAGLPSSSERITVREGLESMASRISLKLFVVFAASAVIGWAANVPALVGDVLNHRLPSMATLTGFAAATLLLGQAVFLWQCRRRGKRAMERRAN